MFTTVENVKALLSHREISRDTVVSEEDCAIFVIIVENRIKLRLKVRGITAGEIADTDYQKGLQEIATLMVAGIVESKHKADSTESEGQESNNTYYSEGRKLLEELMDSIKMNPLPILGSDLEDEDEESEIAPIFKRSRREW